MSKVLTLGESLFRLSSQNGNRLSDATLLYLHYGGAEANVAINLSILGHDVAYATKLPENYDLNNNILQSLRRYCVDESQVIFGEGRLGSYYLEKGSGPRATNVIYDRKYSAISMMDYLEWDLDELFADVSLFHITGITLALSKNWNQLGLELIKEAASRGIRVSFDMNFRQKLWSVADARVIYNELLPYVSILSATERDAITFMDIPVRDTNANEKNEPLLYADYERNWEYYSRKITEKYPNIQYVYGTNRHLLSPNSYDMFGYLYSSEARRGVQSSIYAIHSVIDRVGTGDSYASGILDGLLRNESLEDTVEFAMAACSLKHTIHGDINAFSRQEITDFMESKGQNISR